jgi:arsenite-transporting ATPase
VSALDALIEKLPRVALVVGKGGVGKTTCSVAIATQFAARGERTLLLSTDPAAALSSVLGAPVATTAAPVPSHPNLDARQLDANQLRDAFLAQWRDVIAEIVDRGTYLDRGDVDGLVDAALPGADEIFALLALADLMADAASPYARLVVDTAPTGHTLRLLALPETFTALVAMLDAMQEKHRFMVRALTHRYRRDRADAFLADMGQRIDRLRTVLADGTSLAAVLVTRAEPVVEAESQRYIEQLRALRIRIAGVIVNAAPVEAASYRLAPELLHVAVPRWSPVRPSAASSVRLHQTPFPAIRTLTIVGGKGGVGKSTIACAIAVHAADAYDGAVLLVSTDPAPSLADALGAHDEPWATSDVEHRVPEVPRLTVRQMDAGAAFARLRDEYQSRIDAVFDALVSRGVDAQHDRAIVRDLLALAPPGIDELFALSLLGEAMSEGRFARIVVDPAPTGHLLRLLDMPAVALDWTHRLMRLMLKYQDLTGLGDTAAELLAFAKRTRALQALLHGADAGLVLATLDEPVVVDETRRLVTAVTGRGVELVAVVWNRTTAPASPLPASLAARQFVAAERQPPPIGVAALRDWFRSWRELALSR